MESQTQNPEFRTNPENNRPIMYCFFQTSISLERILWYMGKVDTCFILTAFSVLYIL